MNTNRLRLQAVAVIVMGLVYLASPEPTVARPLNACGGGCGVCTTGSCPDLRIQDSWCGFYCGGGALSCDDCEPDASGCDGDAGWWCDLES